MPRPPLFMLAALLPLFAAPVAAASFSCDKATTPFEHAICDDPMLSRADEVLAKSFATALGGLTPASEALLRADQKMWLDYAQNSCTPDAQPPGKRAYDEMGASCLVERFQTRSTALEQSRMRDGHRFLIKGIYGAIPDPDAVDDPDSNWKVASHEMSFPLLDADDDWAEKFNDYVYARADGLSQVMIDPDTGDYNAFTNTSTRLGVAEIAGENRITLELWSYWYGHGAAHGNYTRSYLHYFRPEDREVEAGDVFAGADWQDVLRDAAWAQLQAEHGDWLQVSDAGEIAEIVIDPTRWSFVSDYGLIIQFQPYEVSAYAYGAPTITIAWTALEDIKAETQDAVRYGW